MTYRWKYFIMRFVGAHSLCVSHIDLALQECLGLIFQITAKAKKQKESIMIGF